MRPYLLFLAATLLAMPAFCSDNPPSLSAIDIMKQVAANQDRAQKERESYLYAQHIRVIIRRSSGKLTREELSDLVVTPGAKDTTRKVESLRGRYWKNGRYNTFATGSPLKTEGALSGSNGVGLRSDNKDDEKDSVPDTNGLDGSLARSFREDLTDDKSKDGMGNDLFPLTSEEQKDLQFELVGEENASGRAAYRIRFGPLDKKHIGWAGEALIDKEELQPISVYTRLSRRLPLFVRSALGTDVPGLGFNVQYKRIDKDIWFPVSFGTEFRIHAVFFINRSVSVSLENKDFKKVSVDSEIQYGNATAPSVTQ